LAATRFWNGKRADAPITVVAWRQAVVTPAQRPPVRAMAALTAAYAGRGEPSARISPDCQRSRSGSSVRWKKSSERTAGSQAMNGIALP
jgi:hypothetical protein